MSDDASAMARRFNDEVMSEGKVEVIDEIVAADFVDHQEFPGLTPDREGLKAFVAMFRAGIPDLKVETIAVVAEGDEIWTHSTLTGTHEGELMGIPPTGKKLSVSMMDRVRIRDGQAVEHWGVSDDLGMLTQLGVIPEMG